MALEMEHLVGLSYGNWQPPSGRPCGRHPLCAESAALVSCLTTLIGLFFMSRVSILSHSVACITHSILSGATLQNSWLINRNRLASREHFWFSTMRCLCPEELNCWLPLACSFWRIYPWQHGCRHTWIVLIRSRYSIPYLGTYLQPTGL